MSYVKKTLQEGEEILFTAKISMMPIWIGMIIIEALIVSAIFVVPDVELAIPKNEIFNYSAGSHQILIFALLAVLVLYVFFGFLPTFFKRIANEMVVTNRRIVHRKGLIFRETEEMDIGAVESIMLSQGMLGRIFNYGNVTVRGRGIGDVAMKGVDDPIKLRNSIQATE